MQWSKAKKKFESLLAPCFQNRLKVHLTKYRETKNFDLGKGWISCDRQIIVSVIIPSFYSNSFSFRTDTMNFGEAFISYVQMSIKEIKESQDELINGLIFLDRRIGKRYINNIDFQSLHPFGRIIYQLRCKFENI